MIHSRITKLLPNFAAIAKISLAGAKEVAAVFDSYWTPRWGVASNQELLGLLLYTLDYEREAGKVIR
jgi:hypothetical protein